MPEITWPQLRDGDGMLIIHWAGPDTHYAITDSQGVNYPWASLPMRYTLWRMYKTELGDDTSSWRQIADTDDLLVVHAWLYEYQHPDFKGESNEP